MPHVGLEELDVKYPLTMECVPVEGKSVSGVMFTGNTIRSVDDIKIKLP